MRKVFCYLLFLFLVLFYLEINLYNVKCSCFKPYKLY